MPPEPAQADFGNSLALAAPIVIGRRRHPTWLCKRIIDTSDMGATDSQVDRADPAK